VSRLDDTDGSHYGQQQQQPLLCTQCHAPTKFGYRLCWKCYTQQRIDGARREAYERGLAEGRRMAKPAASSTTLDVKHIRRLLQLCHPDRHAGSEASVKATQWLLTLLKDVK